MKAYTIPGGGGLHLHAREWGRASGPAILFMHGWSQCHLCWSTQYESTLSDEFRIVALDMRGHGMSEKPLDSEHYTSAQLWADDIAAVIRELELHRPVLVGWSYAGFVICDYLRAYGSGSLGGLNFVGGAVSLGPEAFGTLIGPDFLEPFEGATVDDLPSNIDAIGKFVRGCTARPLPADVLETALCWNMVVPARVRLALCGRTINSDDVLAGLKIPLLITQGRRDTVVLPAMAEHILSTCAGAQASWYPEAGHAPHLEDPARFNHELRELVVTVSEQEGSPVRA